MYIQALSIRVHQVFVTYLLRVNIEWDYTVADTYKKVVS